MIKKITLGTVTVVAVLLFISACIYIVQHPIDKPLPYLPRMKLALGFGLTALVIGYLIFEDMARSISLIKFAFASILVLDGISLLISAPFL